MISKGLNNQYYLAEFLSNIFYPFFLQNVSLYIFAKWGYYFHTYTYFWVIFSSFELFCIGWLYICLLKVILFHKCEKRMVYFSNFLCFIDFLVENGVFGGFWSIIPVFFIQTITCYNYIKRSGILSRLWISYYQPLDFL